jgi:hypothetical protein
MMDLAQERRAMDGGSKDQYLGSTRFKTDKAGIAEAYHLLARA